MRKTLAEIATLVHGEVVGNKDLVITGVCGVFDGNVGELTYIESKKYLPEARATKASAILTARDVSVPGKSIIRTDNPALAFVKIVEIVAAETRKPAPPGFHPTAIIAEDARIGKNTSIGPHVVIESQVVVGEETSIGAGCFIGRGTRLGRACLVYPHVTLREGISVGDRVIIHPGAVIGADGFGFVNEHGKHRKVPQIGTVVIGNDVEIGANTTIDRARLDKTVVGRGTKIDNLVHVGHNCIIGEDCIIIGLVGVSGSTTLGNRVILGGQAGTVGHLTIGEGTTVAARSVVTKDIPPNMVVSGFPAKPHAEAKKINAYIQRLPQMAERLDNLTKRVDVLNARKKSAVPAKRKKKK